MTKYREILRLKSLGFSERNIALSCSVSRKTVARVVHRAQELNISWPLDENQTDAVLEKTMFPKAISATVKKRMPGFAYIRKELLKNGVSKKLLWMEYCEECRMNGEEPLMYSQFCYHTSRMNRNAVLPCTYHASPENRLKLTGQGILRISLIRTPVR